MTAFRVRICHLKTMPTMCKVRSGGQLMGTFGHVPWWNADNTHPGHLPSSETYVGVDRAACPTRRGRKRSFTCSRYHKVQQLNAIVVARPFKCIGVYSKDRANIFVEKQHLVKPRKYWLNILIYVGLVFNLVIF